MLVLVITYIWLMSPSLIDFSCTRIEISKETQPFKMIEEISQQSIIWVIFCSSHLWYTEFQKIIFLLCEVINLLFFHFHEDSSQIFRFQWFLLYLDRIFTSLLKNDMMKLFPEMYSVSGFFPDLSGFSQNLHITVHSVLRCGNN